MPVLAAIALRAVAGPHHVDLRPWRTGRCAWPPVVHDRRGRLRRRRVVRVEPGTDRAGRSPLPPRARDDSAPGSAPDWKRPSPSRSYKRGASTGLVCVPAHCVRPPQPSDLRPTAPRPARAAARPRARRLTTGSPPTALVAAWTIPRETAIRPPAGPGGEGGAGGPPRVPPWAPTPGSRKTAWGMPLAQGREALPAPSPR